MSLISKIVHYIKTNSKIRKFTLLCITPSRNPRPRLWVKLFVYPFIISRGKGAVIRQRRSRFDLFPWNKFHIGTLSTIEDFTTVSNGSGNIYIGDRVRIGIGSVVLGPVTIHSGAGLGQNVFISGFNHGYADASKNSSVQPLIKKGVVIGEESHIGSNSVVVAGVTIGKRCQIGAGSVVTKDVPDYCIVAGNPARIIRRFSSDTQTWERC